jgi:hypothetical protein
LPPLNASWDGQSIVGRWQVSPVETPRRMQPLGAELPSMTPGE